MEASTSRQPDDGEAQTLDDATRDTADQMVRDRVIHAAALAKLAGVSAATMLRLRKGQRCSVACTRDVREAIHATARRLGYRVETLAARARNLR